MSRFKIMIVPPRYLVAIGYPEKFVVTVNAASESEAQAKAQVKFDRMMQLMKVKTVATLAGTEVKCGGPAIILEETK